MNAKIITTARELEAAQEAVNQAARRVVRRWEGGYPDKLSLPPKEALIAALAALEAIKQARKDGSK